MTASVVTLDDSIAQFSADWSLIDDLLGGTPAMRAAGKKRLPQQPRESDEDYNYRLSTATLFPAFERTLSVMAGKPFSKQITPSQDMPTGVLALLDDIDANGTSLHALASRQFLEMVAYNFGGFLVDYTRLGESEAQTLADAQSAGARPYWVLYKHNQILGARFDQFGRLEMIRLLETATIEDGEFGTAEIEQVRVLRPGSWEIHRSPDGKGTFELFDSGTTTLTAIPFVFTRSNPVKWLAGRPPLRDLAYLNEKHWREQSDQDKAARYARARLLVLSGISNHDDIKASSDSALLLPREAKAEVIQGSAESVTVGRAELDALEKQMIQTGAELLTSRAGQRTATEAANDAEANKSALQAMAEDFEDALDQALQFTADWLGLPDGGSVSLFKDYAATSLSDATAQLVVALGNSGIITQETVLREMQRRAIIDASVDVGTEIANAKDAAPDLSQGLSDQE